MIKIGIVGKIWLGMAIMMVGFLVIVGMGWSHSFSLGKRLDSVKDEFYPAVVASTNASTNVKQLLERYNRGVILAEPQIIEEAQGNLAVVSKNLSLIGRNAAARPELKTKANELNVLIQTFSRNVAPLYSKLSKGQEAVNELSPQTLAKYAMMGGKLQSDMEWLQVTLVNDFNIEMSSINLDLQKQQQLNVVLFVLISIISCFSAFFIITRHVKDPIRLTVTAANRIADGNYSQRLSISSHDEIGELGKAFNKMTQHLQDTLSGLQREVAERTRAEEALRINEENLRITLDSIGDAVIATDTDGYITRINPVAAIVTEWDIREATGKRLSDVFHIINSKTRARVDDPIKTILSKGTVMGLAVDTSLLTKSGIEKQIADSGAPIRDAQGNAVGVVLIFRDITEQLIQEEHLRQSQKMDSIGQLAGGVAHDFNNMLGGIMGTAELLKIKLKQDPQYITMVETIISAAEHASGLTQKLLSFSRKGKVNALSLDAHEPINEAIALLERSIDKRIKIVFEPNATSTVIVGDRIQLQNAILNLGLNARDALPDGGCITFFTENVELSEAYCSQSSFTLQPGLFFKFSIHDHGIGMTPETQARVFEPFFTTKDIGCGTGLGLAAVYGCVKEHHGEITLSSTLGKGTVFEIYLPVSKDLITCVEDHVEDHVEDRVEDTFTGEACVLLIDDEEVIRKSASMLLEELGFTVLTAKDGRDGLSVFEKNMDGVDLVILDMVMPRMNGLDCFREIRKLNPSVKVIIASGFTQPENIAQLQSAGVAAFIQKPFNLDELTKALNNALQPETR